MHQAIPTRVSPPVPAPPLGGYSQNERWTLCRSNISHGDLGGSHLKRTWVDRVHSRHFWRSRPQGHTGACPQTAGAARRGMRRLTGERAVPHWGQARFLPLHGGAYAAKDSAALVVKQHRKVLSYCSTSARRQRVMPVPIRKGDGKVLMRTQRQMLSVETL